MDFTLFLIKSLGFHITATHVQPRAQRVGWNTTKAARSAAKRPNSKDKNRFGSVSLYLRVYASQVEDGIRLTETLVSWFRF